MAAGTFFLLIVSLVSVQCLENFEWVEYPESPDVRLQHARSIVATMNRAADPCVDFYNYACGNYHHNLTSFYLTNEFNEETGRKILLDPTFNPQNEAEEKAVDYFRSCIADGASEAMLVETMAVLDGILDAHWIGDRFDWMGVESKMIPYGLPVLFDVEIEDGRLIFGDSHRNIPSDLLEEWSVAKYINFTREELKFLTFNDQSLEEVAKCLNDFTRLLKEFARSMSEKPSGAFLSNTNHTIDEIVQSTSTVDLSGYFALAFGRNYSKDQEVTVRSLLFFQFLPQYIESIGRRIVYNFYRWHIAQFLKIRTEDFRSGESTLLTNCYKSTTDFFEPAMASIFGRLFLPGHVRQELMDITERVRDEFRLLIADSEFLDYATKTEAAKKLDAVSIELGYPTDVLNETKLTSSMDDVQINPFNFVGNFLNGTKHAFHTKVSSLSRTGVAAVWKNLRLLNTHLFFLEENKGTIFVSLGFLTPPIFSPNVADFHKYGVFASVIGHVLAYAFAEQGIQYNSEGIQGEWLTSDEEETLKRNKDCFREQYNEYEYKNEKINGTLSLNQNIADHIGVTLGYRAYKKWLEESGDSETDTYSELGLNAQKSFFVSFGQFYCKTKTPEESLEYDWREASPKYVPENIRLKGAVVNSLEFGEVFSCPKDSPMNPFKKCNFF